MQGQELYFVTYHTFQIYDDINPILSQLIWHGWAFKINMTLLRLKRLNVEWRESGFFHVSLGQERHFFTFFFFSPQNYQCRSFQNWHFFKPWFQSWSYQLVIFYTNEEYVGVSFSLKTIFSMTHCLSGTSS